MKLVIFCLIALALAVPAFSGQVVTANFDELPEYMFVNDYYPGASINVEIVGNQYRSPSRSGYADYWDVYLGDHYGICLLNFTKGAEWVDFYIGGMSDYYIPGWYSPDYLGVFDMNGQLLESRGSNGAYWERMYFHYDRPIKGIYMQFGTVPDRIGHPYYIDDLSYEIVPEPSSIAGLALGLLPLGVMVRRRRK